MVEALEFEPLKKRGGIASEARAARALTSHLPYILSVHKELASITIQIQSQFSISTQLLIPCYYWGFSNGKKYKKPVSHVTKSHLMHPRFQNVSPLTAMFALDPHGKNWTKWRRLGPENYTHRSSAEASSASAETLLPGRT